MELNSIEDAKDTGIEKWKQKSIEDLMGFPKPKKREEERSKNALCLDLLLQQLLYPLLVKEVTGFISTSLRRFGV